MCRYWIRLLNHPPRELSAASPCLVLGRSNTSDVVIEDISISRSHARLTWEAGNVFLEDLGSRNGCLVVVANEVVQPCDWGLTTQG